MKSINKRKVTIIILLIIMLIIEIVAFSFSRAEKIKEIEASIIDVTKTIQMQSIKLNATDSGESGYYIVLPEEVGNKQIISYTFDNINSEETDVSTNINQTITKKPGEKIYLTEQELENTKINLNAKYDTKAKNGKNLYNTNLIKILDDKQISVKGYMPEDATLNVDIQNEGTVKEKLKDYINNNVSLKIAYDIKIVSNEKVYEPNEVDENVQVTITGVESVDGNNQKYKVMHIDESNQIEEIENIILKENSILFDANTFSTYAVLLDETMSLTNIATYARTAAVLSAEKSTWDGTTATEFKYGDGTQANPYLITNAKELAYLRDQVNNGTDYENTFFQLTTDIDLNSMEWTPIGNNTNSFRGTFDGAGHIISNATITISTLATRVMSYGFFRKYRRRKQYMYHKKCGI